MVLARMSRAGNVSETSVDQKRLIKPSTSISNLARARDDSRVTTTSTCEELYGPNKDGRTPSPYVIANATSMFDLSSYPDHRYVGTSDEWIPRDGKLVCLTGRHPLNVEPPLSVHQKFKFITITACVRRFHYSQQGMKVIIVAYLLLYLLYVGWCSRHDTPADRCHICDCDDPKLPWSKVTITRADIARHAASGRIPSRVFERERILG
jgi:hypothetical protein